MSARVQYCDYCGEEMGIFVREFREPLTCGKPECERYARDADAQEREEAHRELDDSMGWGR